MPRVVGKGYHFVDTNPVNVVTATHDVVEYLCSKVPEIPPRTYPSLMWMRAPNVTRYVILERAVLPLPPAKFKDHKKKNSQ